MFCSEYLSLEMQKRFGLGVRVICLFLLSLLPSSVSDLGH